jgi:hypothetical protein
LIKYIEIDTILQLPLDSSFNASECIIGNRGDSAHIPVVSRIVQASRQEPYLAVRIELEIAVLFELPAQLRSEDADHMTRARPLLYGKTEAATMDCVSRLKQLINCPAAIPILRSGIIRELHYWLLAGQHAGDIEPW